MSVEKNLEFFMLVGQLKNVKRTGWVDHEVKQPESVADHMYRMAIMSFLLKNENNDLDTTRCLKLAVVHDLAECIVGDITPSDPMGKEEKHRREKEAMDHLASLVNAEVGKELQDLYEEYENQNTLEARAVKDLDRFEMILQAFEYEKAESRIGELQDFFDSTKGTKWIRQDFMSDGDFRVPVYTMLARNEYDGQGKFQNPTIKEWVQELEKKRAACEKK